MLGHMVRDSAYRPIPYTKRALAVMLSRVPSPLWAVSSWNTWYTRDARTALAIKAAVSGILKYIAIARGISPTRFDSTTGSDADRVVGHIVTSLVIIDKISTHAMVPMMVYRIIRPHQVPPIMLSFPTWALFAFSDGRGDDLDTSMKSEVV